MRTKTPIFACSVKPTIFLNHNAELTATELKIRSITTPKDATLPDNLETTVVTYTKLLLDDIITLQRFPKSVFISYIYIISGNNIYICYDAISIKDGGENQGTLSPTLFVKGLKLIDFIKKLKGIVRPDQLKQLLQSGHVHLDLKFEKINLNDIDDNANQRYEFTIHQEIKFFRYPWGEVIKVFPIPKLPEPGNTPKHGQLFGIDNDVCGEIWESIEKLNTILRTPGNKKVFIKGEPGSGKEVFANAIHYGSVRSKPNNFVVRSVAGANTKKLRELLFGREVDGVSLPGLIEKADGGTLFLDEFDKIKNPDFYSELLRVLEAEEYIPVEGRKVHKVGDVNWIFAGAFMDAGVSKAISDLPQDFWSRLTSYIKIKNPIQFQLQKDEDPPPFSADYIISEDFFCTPRKRRGNKYSYAQVVFLYFFLQEAVEKGQDVDNITTNKKGNFRSKIIRTLFINHSDGLLRPSEQLLEFAKKFNEEINEGRYLNTEFSLLKPNSKKDLLDSVRSIRQAAKVAFSKCYYSALKEEDPADFWKNTDKKDQDTALEEAVESVKIARKN